MHFRRNNGGEGKTHEQVEQTPRIDSFELSHTHAWGGILCGGKYLDIYQDTDHVEIFPPKSMRGAVVELSHKNNGFGWWQTFFLCPECGERVRFLYLTGRRGFLCRRCARLNYRSQQRTKDSMVNYDDGMKYAERHLSTPACSIDGFTFCGWMPERPRYMHRSTYLKHMRRFLKYRLRYEERTLSDLRRIIGPVGWSETQRLRKEDGP